MSSGAASSSGAQGASSVPPAARTAAALKVPKVIRTGNRVLDEEAEQRRECLMTIIDKCIQDPTNIMPLYFKLQHRQAEVSSAPSEGMFNVPLPSLSKIEEKFLLGWLTEKSGLSGADLGNMVKWDSGSTMHLLHFALQMNLNMKLPSECQVRDVTGKMMRWRYEQVGSRLHRFKELGYVLSTGQIKWQDCGAYKMEWAEDRTLKGVMHITGVAGVIPAGCTVTRGWVLVDNFSDMQAHFANPPMPPVKLHIFFQSAKSGPFSFLQMMGTKAPKLFDTVQALHADWLKQKSQVAGETAVAGITEALDEIAAVRTEAKQEGLKKARASAAVALQAKRARRSIVLTE
jgi:hypothetical protein